jgi:hypothetical protein
MGAEQKNMKKSFPVRILEEHKELKITKDQLLATKDEEIRRISGTRLRLKINFNL